jgi:uncharacterized protein
MATFLLGAGLVLVFEGLVLALAPKRLEEALQFLMSIPPETRRVLGLGALAGGVLLIWLARGFGA